MGVSDSALLSPQFHAMDTLHQNEYDITQATSYLVPRGPVLCADELEAWTQGMACSNTTVSSSTGPVCVCVQRRLRGLKKDYRNRKIFSTFKRNM